MNVQITDGYKRCFEYIDDGTPVIMVSGKAGTGKSVLIEQICKRYYNRVIIKVAPTGIAALNIRGQTIHSFFRLPMGVLTERRIANTVAKMMPYGSAIYDAIDMIIIEEKSMVRADQMDAIDTILKRMRRSSAPFGGVQTILVGDLYQLPPVVTDDDEEEFRALYKSEYFFSSQIMHTVDLMGVMEVVLLDDVFRQSDNVFVNILNDVRVNKNAKKNTKILNEVCFYDPPAWDDDGVIVLCATNHRANQINEAELRKLSDPAYTYDAEVSGEFQTKNVITPEKLTLKAGARVMFTKNGDLWVNGTLGVVEIISASGIQVRLDDLNVLVTVPRETWEVTRFRIIDGKVVENVIGTFKQFPLTLAWAVTIHKSQGLTFDKLILDLGKEAFAFGQVYVALSRARSLDGIKLLRPIHPFDIKVDPRVAQFYKKIAAEYTATDGNTNEQEQTVKQTPDVDTSENSGSGVGEVETKQ